MIYEKITDCRSCVCAPSRPGCKGCKDDLEIPTCNCVGFYDAKTVTWMQRKTEQDLFGAQNSFIFKSRSGAMDKNEILK